MQPDLVPIRQLKPGDVFEHVIPGAETTRDSVFRVEAHRRRTTIAENVAGVRRSFTRGYKVKPAGVDAWNRFAKVPVPAMPFASKKKAAPESGAA